MVLNFGSEAHSGATASSTFQMDTQLQPPLIVFSDLDGTLLDHETYDHSEADPALAKLRVLGVPLVLPSSKTAAEVSIFRSALGFDACPAIVENGAGVLDAGPYQTEEAPTGTYRVLRETLRRLPARLRHGFAGFGDWDVAGIVRRTGLSEQAACLARARQFLEPGEWSGSRGVLEVFLAELGAMGVTARQSGRFLTLSFGSSKADRMEEIIARLTAPGGQPPRTLALGDAPNDTEMLERAARGVIVANPYFPPLPRLSGETTGAIMRSRQAGPVGWNECVIGNLAEIDQSAACR
jgi:mannosyl-3-phosphoglycerate phosphatase